MIAIAIVIVITSILIWKCLKKPSNYPPGPWGLPLIGSPPASLENFSKKLYELREKHGDAIGWRIGTKFIVVLFDYNLIKECYSNPHLAARPDASSLIYLQGESKLGIISPSGHLWRTNRRIALKHLRDFGMGKPRLLEVAHYEADFFVSELKKQVGRPAPVPHALTIAISNIVWQMVISRRYEFDDADVNKFCKLISDTHVYGSKLVILDIFPWIKKIFPEFVLNALFHFHVQTELTKHIKSVFGRYINEHLKDLNENHIRDYVDTYLIEMKKQESNPESTFSTEDLIFCMSDIFEGASETTDLSINWTMLYLAKFPKIQEKLQKEIDEVLPKGNSFSMEDKSRLPYTEAFIHEVLRYSSVASGPPRAALEDTKVGNYLIPKGSFVIYSTLVVHTDPRYYDSPQEFRPERFLDLEGKFTAPKEGFAPFGLGARVCIGEAIARMELFVFITKLIQNFHFEYPPGEEFDLEGVVSPFFRPPKGSPRMVITLR